RQRRWHQLGHRNRHGAFPCRRRCCPLFLYLEGVFRCHVPVVGFREPRHRHELSPAPHPSWIQNSQVGGILPHLVRHARARRRTDFLGGDASHSSPVFRRARRS